jgi:diguanylate cyclase (GGDEF)-like protein
MEGTMKKLKPENIPVYIMALPVIGIIITVIAITITTYFTVKNNSEYQKQILTKEFMENLKKVTKRRVEIAYYVIDSVYKSNLNSPDPKEKTLKVLPEIFDKIKWGKKGYIFIMDFKGNTIYHPNHKLIGVNRWNLERNGMKIVQFLTKKALEHPEGTYAKYWAYNPEGKKPLEKISYLKVYKPLNIYLGSGVYLDYLDKELLKRQKEHSKLYQKLIENIFFIAGVIVIVMALVMLILSNIVRKVFLKYENELKSEKEKLFRKANFDSLTQLVSKDYFESFLKKEIAYIKRKNALGAVLFIDIDRFKEINDSLGHDYGNETLQEIANRLKSSVRETDLVGRFGGDEFVVFLKDIDKETRVIEIAQRILNKLKQPIKLGNHTHYISGSIGIALIPKDGDNVVEIIKNADTAMYAAKKRGKDRFEFFTKQMSEEAKKRLKTKNDLYNALRKDELVPFFQPQMDKHDKLYGSEVLVRWIKDGKIVPPGEFIPIAIEIGLIDKIDLHIIEKAIIQYKEWERKGYNPGIISCNVTMYQLEKTDFASHLKELIEKYNFNPSKLNIEVTEESVMKDPEISINMLEKIRNLGININIDDFGTGYSSLSYLKKLPVSKLKIDRSFIKDIPNDKDDVMITKTIISLAKNMNLKVIAEGVENKVQRDFVFNEGCDYVQGYYYSPPIKAEDFEEKYLKGKNGS